jgi:hypothetical protein
VGEAVRLETLHPPAFVVHTDQQVFAHFLMSRHRSVARDSASCGQTNQAAHQRVLEALPIGLVSVKPAMSMIKGAWMGMIIN